MRLSDAQYAEIKEQIKDWVLRIDEDELLPKGIKVLHFGLSEPYTVELTGSKMYNTDDDEWVFRQDFVPDENECPDLEIDEHIAWETFLKTMVRILKELNVELKEIDLFKVGHITTGFTGSDIVAIR
jgi:shikimate kinase